ncbi:MAG: hypothetical protein WD652_03470, partial [Acidimicrobiia bacterium]
LVFAVGYTTGRALVPTFGPRLEAVVADFGSEPGLLAGLSAELDSVAVPAAIIEISGSVEGRFVLDVADVPLAFESLGSEGPDYGPNMPVDLDARYSARGVTLALVADQVAAGMPRTEAITVAVSVDGRSFSARPGDCTLELATSGYDPEKSGSGFFIYWQVFTGHVICTDIADIRGGEPISFTAVFDHAGPSSH